MKISLDNKDENSKKQSISSATDLEKKLVEMIRFKKKLSNVINSLISLIHN